MLSYFYKKYIDWSDFYRNREPNQYETTLYPRVLDPIKEEVKPNGIAKLTYREALLKNITKK